MILNKKYQYDPVERVTDETGRHYLVNNSPVPSVTTILSSTADKTALIEWRERVGDIEADKIVEQASTIGTNIHTNLENYIQNKPIVGSYLERTLTKLIIKNGLKHVNEVWGLETPLYIPDLYAGTADLVGVHQGKQSIMDFKNSRKEKKKEWIEDYFLQLSAYAFAHDFMFGTNIERGVIMMAVRNIKYQEFIIEGDEFKEYKSKWLARVNTYYSNLAQ